MPTTQPPQPVWKNATLKVRDASDFCGFRTSRGQFWWMFRPNDLSNHSIVAFSLKSVVHSLSFMLANVGCNSADVITLWGCNSDDVTYIEGMIRITSTSEITIGPATGSGVEISIANPERTWGLFVRFCYCCCCYCCCSCCCCCCCSVFRNKWILLFLAKRQRYTLVA